MEFRYDAELAMRELYAVDADRDGGSYAVTVGSLAQAMELASKLIIDGFYVVVRGDIDE